MLLRVEPVLFRDNDSVTAVSCEAFRNDDHLCNKGASGTAISDQWEQKRAILM